MGRYYRETNSDAFDGKFWFAVQDSYALSKYGFEEAEPNYIEYVIYRQELDQIEQGLSSLEAKHSILHRDIDLDELYETKEQDKKILVDYADYELLLKIFRSFDDADRDCIIIECEL